VNLQEQLRARGYRLTPQRELVLDAVTVLGHATPEEALAWIHDRSPGVNISTVYRTLELLEDLGLVRHAHLSHGAPTYHAGSVAEHVHLVCRSCEAVIELPPDAVSTMVDSLERDHGFIADVGHLTIFGVCEECAG
jgi:Fur family transcriptional regulator, ferric uptake regulator